MKRNQIQTKTVYADDVRDSYLDEYFKKVLPRPVSQVKFQNQNPRASSVITERSDMNSKITKGDSQFTQLLQPQRNQPLFFQSMTDIQATYGQKRQNLKSEKNKSRFFNYNDPPNIHQSAANSERRKIHHYRSVSIDENQSQLQIIHQKTKTNYENIHSCKQSQKTQKKLYRPHFCKKKKTMPKSVDMNLNEMVNLHQLSYQQLNLVQEAKFQTHHKSHPHQVFDPQSIKESQLQSILHQSKNKLPKDPLSISSFDAIQIQIQPSKSDIFNDPQVVQNHQKSFLVKQKLIQNDRDPDFEEIQRVVNQTSTLRNLQIKNRQRMKHFAQIFATKNLTKLKLEEHHYRTYDKSQVPLKISNPAINIPLEQNLQKKQLTKVSLKKQKNIPGPVDQCFALQQIIPQKLLQQWFNKLSLSEKDISSSVEYQNDDSCELQKSFPKIIKKNYHRRNSNTPEFNKIMNKLQGLIDDQDKSSILCQKGIDLIFVLKMNDISHPTIEKHDQKRQKIPQQQMLPVLNEDFMDAYVGQVEQVVLNTIKDNQKADPKGSSSYLIKEKNDVKRNSFIKYKQKQLK